MTDETEEKTTGIAILGSHPATVMEAPFEDDDWLIYACSPHNVEHRTLPRVDAWFEIHKPVTHETRGYKYLRTIEDMDQVYVRDPDALEMFKNAVEYPEADMKDKFCPFMFTSSIAFMLAKAITDCEEQNRNTIGVWGVMQASPNEYMYQRPGIQYFLWEAKKRGIDVMVPEESKLFELPAENF